MIAQVTTKRQKIRFLSACRGVPALGAVMPLAWELFGKSMPGRFYAGPTLAVELSGRTARVAGHANPEELAGFLALSGCRAALLGSAACPVPAGWSIAEPLRVFSLAPGAALPLPAADEALWASLVRNPAPSPGQAARLLFAPGPRRDDFYSETCTKLARGKARVWALENEAGEPVCTVGAYALYGGQAYMACGQTIEPLRGQGIGGRLIVQMANALAAEGLRPVFLCKEERVRFYTRLGFAPCGALRRCTAPAHAEG